MVLLPAVLLAGLLLSAPGCDEAPPPLPGDVVLVVLDTTRADHLSAYGYLRQTTPHLERLAAEGQRFDNAWAQSSWTLPAMATLLTGLPPYAHGAGRGPGGRGMLPLRPQVATLAERMSGVGYRTAAFINVIWCSPEISGLDRGFRTYDFRTSDESNRGQRDAAATTRAALDWLRDAGEDPVFIVVHYFDPHLTYDPRAPYDSIFEERPEPRIPPGFGSAAEVFRVRRGELRLDPALRKSLIARYDGEIRYADAQFGKLREALEQLGRWDDALVIVVGDHGEEFWDHGGFEHGHSHHREVLRMPLIVKRPGDGAGVSDDRVRQIDIVPTVIDFVGLPPVSDLPGGVLGTVDADVTIGEGTLWGGRLISARSDAGTLILDRDSGDLRFYAPQDTWERHPMTEARQADPSLLELLRALPERDTTSRDAVPLSDEQLEKLRSLGYVE
jgi:arylsulfatase A-like enzyme